jgi:hypothetical protein
MGKVVATEFLSLDGVTEDSGGIDQPLGFDIARVLCALLTLLVVSRPGYAQAADPVTEVGLHLVSLRIKPVEEHAIGIGAVFARDVLPLLSIDAEVNYFPENPSGNFGETEALLGVKLGTRSDQMGLFAKARFGFVHFGGDFFDARLPNPTKVALDLGLVFEHYARSGRWGWRVDGGDTIIPFGADMILFGGDPPIHQPGTSHNFQLAVGLVFKLE